MENRFGSALAVEPREAARMLGLATIAADKGKLAAAHASLRELAAKIAALRLQ
jgi:hypothetical protein